MGEDSPYQESGVCDLRVHAKSSWNRCHHCRDLQGKGSVLRRPRARWFYSCEQAPGLPELHKQLGIELSQFDQIIAAIGRVLQDAQEA
jgi:hypothetical protein